MDESRLDNDSGYFARRASEQRARAATCGENTAKLAHLKMADAYDKRVSDPVSVLQIATE